MNIRNAEEQDFPAISRLFWESDTFHAENLPSIYNKTDAPFRSIEYYRELINNPEGLFIVSENAGEVLGFAYGYEDQKGTLPIHKKRTFFFLDNIVVRKDRQGSGLGSQLLDRIITECRERKYSDIMLNVYSFNAGAIALYEKKGFTQLSRDYILEL